MTTTSNRRARSPKRLPAQMRAAGSMDEFLADPIGRYYRGESFVVWVYQPNLAGVIYFDRTDERDLPLLARLSDLLFHSAFEPPLDAFIDCSRFGGLSSTAYELLDAHLALISAGNDRMRRIALVRPEGLAGVTVTGVFYMTIQATFPAALFTDRIEALQWLDRDDTADCRAQLDALSGQPKVIAGLRTFLATHLDRPSLKTAARAASVSTRTLQRELRNASTNFRAEVVRARVRAAEALLIESDDKISAVARSVGCASVAHFNTMFRRITGERPSEFRLRRRDLRR
jgi:AraC-like DNA-binding protein